MFRIEHVSKCYRQKEKTIQALQATDLVIAAGEFVAVVGPSGSGKSTLLTLLGGMLAPDTGKVWFQDCSLYDLRVEERAKIRRSKMGFVFQTFNLIPYLTAQGNVSVPLLLRGESGMLQRHRSLELLSHLGLGDRAQHKPSELSIGQQQRVALARALANDPEVIFADEPTGNLDPETRDHVFGFFEEVHRAGKTIVMVTHDPEAARRATRVLRMDRGGKLLEGEAQESSWKVAVPA
jgi:putative ABC transport system ATP-binding protein